MNKSVGNSLFPSLITSASPLVRLIEEKSEEERIELESHSLNQKLIQEPSTIIYRVPESKAAPETHPKTRIVINVFVISKRVPALEII